MTKTTISQAIGLYIESISMARSRNTTETYRFAMSSFMDLLANHHVDVINTPVDELDEAAIGWFAAALKDHTPATERVYLQATAGFYRFIAAERMASPNLPRLQELVKQRSRRQGQRLPQFPREEIEAVLAFVSQTTASLDTNDEREIIRFARDRAFLLTLADTGLRVHEACNLRRGDIDWNEGRAIIIGKGNKQAVIRFSSRSMRALRDYLSARSLLDGSSGRPLPSLPLFARHDRGAGKKVKPITTATGRNIVEERVRQALGNDATGRITPHSFRHYFVTTVLRASGNLKLAQELARHSNISVTQRYAHLSDDELDKGYHQIFNE